MKYFPDNLREKIAIIIIGDGDRWNCIDDLIKKNHLNNIFLMKSVKKEILINYYEISDFAISSHPSEPDLYKYGLCPLKDIDYMYNNLPILFMGDKSYLNNSSSSGIVEVDSNDKYSIEKNLNFVSNLSKEELKKKPYVTVAHITTGKYNIFCKIRAKGTEHAREIIFSIDDIEGVLRTETMISLEESINDKKVDKKVFVDAFDYYRN